MLPNERELLRQSRHYAIEKRWLSWWHLASTLAIAIGLLAAICVFEPWFVRLPLSVLTGLLVVRLFIVYHDFLHGAILQGSRVARLLLHAYGVLVLNPPSIWSRSHDHHHRNVGKAFGASIGSYPIMTPAAYDASTRGQRIAYALSRSPLTIACGYLTIFLYGMCLRSFAVNPRLHADSAVAVVLHLALVAALAIADPSLLLFAVLVPMTVACAVGAYLFYAQHNYPDAKVLPRGGWTYCSAALLTSSFIRMGPLWRWFTGNIGYHHVHHVNARIPFYRLPEAMAGIVGLQSPGMTSLSLADIRRCLGLKLWDPEKARMTGFPAGHERTRIARV